ncbi:MAG TPA: hypothetical protein ENJ39_02360 [Flammeovirgaceae bacterium]|nr:hypothetical protein [Flammeovirgaceae bacterium]
MPQYRVLYNGYGANRAVYREQYLTVHLRPDWSAGTAAAADVLYLVHHELKKHFGRYEILSIEKLT